MEKTQNFYNLAKEYCCFIAEKEITVSDVPTLIELLMNLYIMAMNLPELEPETNDSSSSDSDRLLIHFDKQVPTLYWEVFNPYVQEEPVCGDLFDDLSDIALDVKNGMKEYEAGRIGNAVFEWKNGLNSHWGHHIVDALRALHTIRSR